MSIPYETLSLSELRTALESLHEIRAQCSFIDYWPDAQRCQKDADAAIGKIPAEIQKRQLEWLEDEARAGRRQALAGRQWERRLMDAHRWFERSTPIERLPLSARARNALRNHDCETLRDLLALVLSNPGAVHRVPNIGRRSVHEINAFVAPYLETNDDDEFIAWCRRNRSTLELLRSELLP